MIVSHVRRYGTRSWNIIDARLNRDQRVVRARFFYLARVHGVLTGLFLFFYLSVIFRTWKGVKHPESPVQKIAILRTHRT